MRATPSKRRSSNLRAGFNVVPFHRKGALLIGARMLVPCQVRSRTESPCPHRAVVEIRGVAFCGACAREQEAYFAIGELVAQEKRQGFRSKLLAEALKRMRRERTAGGGGTTADPQRGISGVYETKRPALRAS